VTLPFTGATLQGLDVEPTTIRDFKGFSAVAFHVGHGDRQGRRALRPRNRLARVPGDLRRWDWTRRFGTFAFI